MRPFVLPGDGDGKAAGCVLWGGQEVGGRRIGRPWGMCEGGDRPGMSHHPGCLTALFSRWEQALFSKTEGL